MSTSAGAAGYGDDWAELVVGRALDALEPGDEARLDAHLPGCSDCRALLADMTHVAASLAYGVDEAEPPAELLERIQAALPSRRPAEVRATVTPAQELSGRRQRRAAGRGPSRHARPAPRLLTATAGLSAAAALIVAGFYTANLHTERDKARASLAAEASVISTLQRGSAYSVPLSSAGPATGAVVVSGHTVELVTSGLDHNDTSSSQYVLWAGVGSQPLSAVRGFDVTADGVHVVGATLPASTPAPTAFAVTEERGRTLPTIPGRLVLGKSSAA